VQLERWMIDEIIDSDVRILRAILRDAAPERGPVETAVSIRPRRQARPGRPRVRAGVEAAAIRRAAVDLEAAPTTAWTPETEAIADLARMTAFLIGGAKRSARPGLPVRETLREGDVYWVIVPGAAGREDAPARDLAVDETAALLDALDEVNAEAWDVTAAARQVMKRLYAEAAFARADERPTGEQRVDG
jgi:hypothetical protein